MRVWYVKGNNKWLTSPSGWNIGDQSEFTFRVIEENSRYTVWLGFDEMNTIEESFLTDYHARIGRAIKLVEKLKKEVTKK